MEYPTYVEKPKTKKPFIETWATSVPTQNRKKFFITIGIILGFFVLVIVIVVIMFMNTGTSCKDAFCKVAENVQQKINSKVITK